MEDVQKIDREIIKNKISTQKTQKELYLTDARVKKLEKEIIELNKTAQELTNFIKKIEKTSPYKQSVSTLSIEIDKKSLKWPVNGEVISSFGKQYVKELNTYLINDGIKIKTSAQSNVVCVMDGIVVFSGEFRGFGNVVIVDHGNNIYTTYGFLKDIYVEKGVSVKEGTIIGSVGKEMRNISDNVDGVLYFEIRRGEIALNPLDYLR